MSSLRSRSQSRNMSGNGPMQRRAIGHMETSSEDFTHGQGTVTSKPTSRLPAPRFTTQSRIPQNPAARRPSASNTQPHVKDAGQPWNSTAYSSQSTPAYKSSAIPVKEKEIGTTQPRARPVLRRKQSLVPTGSSNARNPPLANHEKANSTSMMPRPQVLVDLPAPRLEQNVPKAPVENHIPLKVDLPVTRTETLYPELDRYRNIQVPRDGPASEMLFRLATHDLPPPTPLFSGASSHSQLSSFSGSPSTRFSESPGGGPYSRDTTPTSMSSVSPGLVFPSRSTVTRIKQPSRPPVTRRRAGSTTRADDDDDASDIDSHALSIVQESLASSSSSSTTVRDVEKNSKKKGLLDLRPPNPPPRKSSHKLRKEYDNHASPSKTSRKQAPLVMRSPSPVRSPPQTLPLNVQKVTASPQARATPPSRPSRENTPDLYSQFGGPLPIIQSNLSSTSLTERRRSGQIAPSSLPRSMSSTSIQDQQIRPKVPVSRQPTPNPKPTPTSLPQPGKAEPGRPTRTPSPGVSTFRSKFGLFTRRKTDSDANTDKKEKPSRKGPAAGTGHEGYGKMGAVRRRNSSTAPPAGASSSSDSLASTQSVDPFFLARLNPVVIAGGEIIENRNASAEISRNDSSQSLAYTRPSIDSRKGSSTSLSSREDARNTLWPSAMPHPSHSHRPSNSSDIGADPMKSTLAFRRSIQRLGTTGDHKPVNLPQPINTRGITSPSLASVDTIFTDDSLALSQSDLELPQTQLAPAPRKLTKRPKSPRKWNLFGRSQKKDTTATKPTAVDVAPSKPVAFYTIIDSSEQEDSERPDITDILRDADIVVPPSLPAQSTTGQGHERNPSTLSQDSADQPTQPTQPTLAQGVAMSQKQNSPMIFQPQISLQHKPVDVEMKTGQIKTSVGRPSRLPQVGRIPKVVNRRPEHTSTKSFSRPFNRISLQLPPPNRRSMNGDSIAKGPSPPTSSTPELSQDASTITTSTVGPPPRSLGHKKSRSLDSARPSGEFLAFPIRKGSECTTSSSSSSSGIALFAQHVAVIPAPTAPLAEDEIWDEYNDLLGDVPPSATSSRGIPFHLENYGTKLAKRITGPLESPTVRTFPPQEQAEEEPKDEAKDVRSSITTGKSTSSHFSADMTARINAAFRFGTEPPETPFSVSEFVSEYEDRNNTTESPDIRRSVQRSSASSAKSRQTRASGSSSASDESPLAQVNLRVGSMTVSKWLTFGHVLFSPARDELVPVVGSLKRHSILVIDGLGNDDWSFYAAETYPAATFFNLSPRAPVSQEQRTATQFPASPSNHHQIQYTSHMDKFPFGSESFTTVVFRFPAMAPESHYRNIISEARRVLKPGGYVELSILDVDLNKMGSHTRRAVRQLKERISAQQAEISLSSTADTILRLLGKQGFTDIKNCWVGVPVASAIAGSSSERGSRRRTKDERSLAEMMNDETEKGDANITKMVAKVGRWWYNRLYETSTGMKTSIWRDRTVLTECEEYDTRLKLMVCYAKIPETKTRLASI
ncbi:hypothetical protein PFICI_07852 [Pestalotiopsis fici W106-1]|uniref:Methyltransferase type 11 domain-containing protein n=1 Tax=Pestalotiopsis fici (strain W106-1 / CGMCC3.15140) TaxID=1229662 RepID=W3X2G1_PESFW|nr:uncharacterized protein PFICI_07852 [Pestalotiopsis fici W106-1]ETS80323.1 hypothetical protein PFICI_07852 [Pestalotiopsis fici W106-1]